MQERNSDDLIESLNNEFGVCNRITVTFKFYNKLRYWL